MLCFGYISYTMCSTPFVLFIPPSPCSVPLCFNDDNKKFFFVNGRIHTKNHFLRSDELVSVEIGLCAMSGRYNITNETVNKTGTRWHNKHLFINSFESLKLSDWLPNNYSTENIVIRLRYTNTRGLFCNMCQLLVNLISQNVWTIFTALNTKENPNFVQWWKSETFWKSL